jgi:aspartyl-tRNA(Asn)/glutamyl-tRNA(Gln) amidotransferase subunit B
MIPVIGLEIHLQVKTNTKMFCRCPAEYFGKSPNINVCPVCTGMPGALPVPNKEAFRKAIILAIALNCEIATNTKFDRKNYYYPDLPKGYQISQYDQPIGKNGFVEIDMGDDSRRIRIKRVHLEEDTAKSIHADDGETLIDFNKSGVPLIEIVTEPDFQSIDELIHFGKRLRQIVRYSGVSDAEMQKGQMRFELNISVKKDPTQKQLPDYRVEIKNIGSISVLENVARLEIERQKEILKQNKKIVQQTRGLKNMEGETILQRIKENADDYRYFPEPDIPPISISSKTVEELKNSLGEMPQDRKDRYMKLGISEERAEFLVENPLFGNLFDNLGKEVKWDKNIILEAIKWIGSELVGLLENNEIEQVNLMNYTDDIIYIVKLLNENKITRTVGKKVLETVVTNGKSAKTVIKSQNLLQIHDTDEIENWVNKVIESNPKVVADISKNPNAIKFLIGQVMQLSKGKANPKIVEQILQSKLL